MERRRWFQGHTLYCSSTLQVVQYNERTGGAHGAERERERGRAHGANAWTCMALAALPCFSLLSPSSARASCGCGGAFFGLLRWPCMLSLDLHVLLCMFALFAALTGFCFVLI